MTCSRLSEALNGTLAEHRERVVPSPAWIVATKSNDPPNASAERALDSVVATPPAGKPERPTRLLGGLACCGQPSTRSAVLDQITLYESVGGGGSIQLCAEASSLTCSPADKSVRLVCSPQPLAFFKVGLWNVVTAPSLDVQASQFFKHWTALVTLCWFRHGRSLALARPSRDGVEQAHTNSRAVSTGAAVTGFTEMAPGPDLLVPEPEPAGVKRIAISQSKPSRSRDGLRSERLTTRAAPPRGV